MENLKSKNFALFFTRNLSLQKWDTLGMLDREIKLYQELSKAYKTVYLCTYGTRDKSYAHLFPENVTIIERPKWIPGNLYSILLPFLHAGIFRTVDIVKTNQMDGSWTAILVKKLYRSKLIVRCGYEWFSFLRKGSRGWLKRAFAYQVEKFAYRNADRISITSSADKKFITETFGISPGRVEIISNYVDTEKFKPLPLEKVPGRIACLGRIEKQKNLFALVNAMTGIPAHLMLIGSGSCRQALEELAREKGVTVIWKGNVPQNLVVEELNKAELFILPSFYEGNPKALLEAMSCGLPCIGTNVPGISSVITDGKNGVLCETDATSIHEAIIKVLHDPNLQKTIRAGARETVLQLCSFERILEQELTLHRSLL